MTLHSVPVELWSGVSTYNTGNQPLTALWDDQTGLTTITGMIKIDASRPATKDVGMDITDAESQNFPAPVGAPGVLAAGVATVKIGGNILPAIVRSNGRYLSLQCAASGVVQWAVISITYRGDLVHRRRLRTAAGAVTPARFRGHGTGRTYTRKDR